MATGKISRLPREIREQMNRKMDGGEPPRATVGSDVPRSELADQRCEPHWHALPVAGARVGENLAKLKRIKVDQGEKIKKAEEQTKLVNCSPSPVSSPPGPPGRGDHLARFQVQESVTTSATMGGVRTEGNDAKSESIKVNQGEVFSKKEEVQTGFVGCPAASGRDGARRSRLNQTSARQDGAAGRRKTELAGQRCEPHWHALPVAGARMGENSAKLKRIKVDQGNIFICRRGRSRTIRLRQTSARQGTRTLCLRYGMACHPPPDLLAAHCFYFSVCRSFRNPQICVAIDKC
jgi:hypothetical protein